MKELNDFRKFLNEGTWSLGTVAEMVKVMGKLNQIRRMGAARGGLSGSMMMRGPAGGSGGGSLLQKMFKKDK